MLFFAIVYVTFAIVLSGNSIKKQPQRNENLFFCKLGQTACFLFPDCFGPGGGRTISSFR